MPAPTKSTQPGPVVDIAIPVFNEERVLELSVGKLHSYLTATFPFSWRITIVDNASTDGTLEVAQSLAARLPHVAVRHLEEKGRGRALKDAWLASDAEIVAYMDVDLSTGLNALLPLIAPLLSRHSDVAIGSRLARASSVARGPQREFISRVYNVILHIVFLNRFRDAQCGFKAMPADLARALLPAVVDSEWFFDTELLLLAEHNGLRVYEVPVDWVDDPDSRVHIRETVKQDLQGIARVFRTFAVGEGGVPLRGLERREQVNDLGRQFVGFFFVGILSAAASLLLFAWWRAPLGPIAANLLAITATTLVNVWSNRRYTFGYRGRRDRARQYVESLLLWLIGAGIATLMLALVVAGGSTLFAELAVLCSASVVMAAVRFTLLRVWVFRARELPAGLERVGTSPQKPE